MQFNRPLKDNTMKNLKIIPKIIFSCGLLLFLLINFYGKSSGTKSQDCEPYLKSTNIDLRKVRIMSSTIQPPFESCVGKMERPGASRRWMVDSYINMMKYYENTDVNSFHTYKIKLSREK